MSRKSAKISALIARHVGGAAGGPNSHYLGYFECFNARLYYEAHDVLEELWLPSRRGPDDLFFKGLIQLAGAFVHLQKQRRGPALALFKLAATNLGEYPPSYRHLDTAALRVRIGAWMGQLEGGVALEDLLEPPPVVRLSS